MMKVITLCFFIVIAKISDSQELNAGLNAGINPNSKILYSIGENFEFRPKNSIASLNFDAFVLFSNKNEITLTLPLYLKFIIGKKFRVCPSYGGFFGLKGNYGWLLGLHLESQINSTGVVFIKNEYYSNYKKTIYFNHFGGSSYYIERFNSFLISIGYKWLLKTKEKS